MGRVVAGEAPSSVAGNRDFAHDAPAPRPADGAAKRRDDPRPVHRLRDLDRAGRWWAVALATAVALAPIAALIHFVPDWAPSSDPALMGIRSLDVGTARTPLLGQPSTAAAYAGPEGHLHHPGALHFYLMAVPIRLLGGALAMPLVSVAITGSCLLVSLWAVFRQLGRAAALVAGALLTVTAFTTGAASLVNPVSSSIAGYPLLATVVLGWCVLCGDLRLLPLATGFLSFAAQQHLSVDPALAVVAAGVTVIVAARLLRARSRPGDADPVPADLRRWGGWSLVVALVMWTPVLAQQVFGDQGNLGQMIDFARHGNSETLGYGRATWQLAHAFGLPPLLGRTGLSGAWLTARPSAATWVSAAAVLASVATVSWRRRRDEPRLTDLGIMVGLVCLAGLVSGASVPVGLEQERITFYHWAVAGAFVAGLTLAVAALHPARRLLTARAPRQVGVRVALGGLAVIAVAVPGVVSTHLDRRTNTLAAAYSVLPSAAVRATADSIVAHQDELGDHIALLSVGEPTFYGVKEAIGFALVERGVDVRFPMPSRFFVHDQRLVDRDEIDGGVMLVIDRTVPRPAPEGGELIAEIDLQPGLELDREAWDALLVQVDEAPQRTPAQIEAAITGAPPDEAALGAAFVADIWAAPHRALGQPLVLDFLLEHPEAAPELDPVLIDRVRESLPTEAEVDPISGMTRIRVYLLDREATLRAGGRGELGPP